MKMKLAWMVPVILVLGAFAAIAQDVTKNKWWIDFSWHQWDVFKPGWFAMATIGDRSLSGTEYELRIGAENPPPLSNEKDHFVFNNGTQYDFYLDWNPSTNRTEFRVFTGELWTTVYHDVDFSLLVPKPSKIDTIMIYCRAVNANTDVEVTNLVLKRLDDTPYADISTLVVKASDGDNRRRGLDLHHPNIALGFKLTGKIKMTWSGLPPTGEDLYALFKPAEAVTIPPPVSASCGTCVPGSLGGLAIDQASNGGNPGATSISTAPIRYGNGELINSETDLQSTGFDQFGITRSWSNRTAYGMDYRNTSTFMLESSFGNNWIVAQFPRLHEAVGSQTLAPTGANHVLGFNFDPSTGLYSGQMYRKEKLTQTAVPYNTLAMDDTKGGETVYKDFTINTPQAQRGKMQEYWDPRGNYMAVTYGTSGASQDRVVEIDRRYAWRGIWEEAFTFGYYTTGPYAGKCSSAAHYKWINSAWVLIRYTFYYYYDGTEANGNLGDLKRVEVYDGVGLITVRYYRYYNNVGVDPWVGGLKYVVGPTAHERLSAAVGSYAQIDAASDATIATYADQYFEYDYWGNVTKEVVNGAGCSCPSAGTKGTFTFTYTQSTNADGYNSWKNKTEEKFYHEDTDLVWTNTIYTNYLSEVMLRTFQEDGSANIWRWYTQFDSAGRIILQAEPSAVTGQTEAAADLMNSGQYLADTTGLYHVTEYYSSTDIPNGAVQGYLQRYSCKQGETGSLVKKSEHKYTSHTANLYLAGVTIYPASSSIIYRNADGTGSITTSYAYTWRTDGSNPSGGNTILSRTTTFPVVTTAQNGPNSADVLTEFFDEDQRLEWVKDEDGYIHYTRYQSLHGSVDRTIVDVNTALTGDFANKPSGWTTPSGGGLHLKTDYRIDNLGRANKITYPNGNITHTVYLDSDWETRIYPGWTGTAPTGPTIVTRRDKLNNYSETLTSNKAPALSGSDPTGAEIIDTASLQTLNRTFYDNGDRPVKSIVYHDFTGLSYSGSPSIGTLNTHFYQVEYGFDQYGQIDRILNPVLTISRIVHDGLGRTLGVWVGLDDTPTSGEWSPSNTAGTDLKQLSENQYDNGGVGNSNLTKTTIFVNGTSTDNRVAEHFYDWRNRRVASKSGVQGSEDTNTHRPIAYCDLDNLGRCTTYSLYDGDQIIMTFSGGVPQKPTSSRRRAQTETFYDEEGKAYQTKSYSVNQSDGTLSSSALTTNSFYDRRGNEIKTSSPGGLVNKSAFDGAGRTKTQYVTDGGGDAAWTDADDVTGDAVLEQVETTFDSNSNVIQVVHKARFHDEATTGSLNSPGTAPKCRRSYKTAYFDLADRKTADVNVGTNAGSVYTRPGTVPSRSDTVLVTSYAFTSAGFVDTLTDPRGQIFKSFYDMMGRRKRAVEAYVNDVPSGSDDRTTVYTYNGLSQILTVKADMPSGSNDQTTQYTYGVTIAGGSDVNSNDLLQKIHFPDKTTGNPSTLSSDQILFTYNAIGQGKTTTDCNQTLRTFGYDVLGRKISDAVTTPGSGVDTAIRRLEAAFDTGGRPFLFTSYDAASGGNIVNQVKRVFNGLYQLTTEYQSISGAVVDATTPKTQYTFTEMAGGANHSRATKITYPNGRIVRIEYNSGVDTTVSRLSFLADDSGGAVGTHVEEYLYLGLETIVARTHPQPLRDLSYIKLAAESTGDAGDQYTGFDRFGRIVDQRWRNSSGTHTDRFEYRYDRVGDRLYKRNLLTSNKSELYHANGALRNSAYDPLERMTTFRRGTLSASGNNGAGQYDTVSTTTDPDTADPLFASQVWTLDHLGNWSSVVNDGTTQTRGHNSQNQITSITGLTTPTFDNNGNMTKDQLGIQFTFDAWNRHKQTKNSGGTLLKTHTYDSLGRRMIEERTATGGGVEYRTLYYTAGWQVVEERVSATPGTEGPARVQYVWSIRYVDEMVLRDRDADSNGSLEERLYVIQDANFNVTATINTSATVQERMLYDPYGSPKFFTSAYGSPTDAGTKTWVYLHQGSRFDQNSKLYHFRNREHHPYLGRWVQRDPIGYEDGMNLYCALGSAPTSSLDYFGLKCIDLVLTFVEDKWSYLGGSFSTGFGFMGTGVDVIKKKVESTEEATNRKNDQGKNHEGKKTKEEKGKGLELWWEWDWEKALKDVKALISSYDPECEKGDCFKSVTVVGHGMSADIGGLNMIFGSQGNISDPKSSAHALLTFISQNLCKNKGTMELRACKVAQHDRGKEFIKTMAELAGLSVKAWDDWYFAVPYGKEWTATPGKEAECTGDTGRRFEGTLREVIWTGQKSRKRENVDEPSNDDAKKHGKGPAKQSQKKNEK